MKMQSCLSHVHAPLGPEGDSVGRGSMAIFRGTGALMSRAEGAAGNEVEMGTALDVQRTVVNIVLQWIGFWDKRGLI